MLSKDSIHLSEYRVSNVSGALHKMQRQSDIGAYFLQTNTCHCLDMDVLNYVIE